MVKVKIKDLAPGAFFDIGPVKVKVMEHFADGKTLLAATEPIGNRPFTVRPFTYKRQDPEPNPNDFRFSTLKDDLNTDFLAAVAAGGVLLPVKPNGTVYVIHRRRVMSATVMFVGAGADGLTSFSVLRGRLGTTAWSSMQFTENDIGQTVFLTAEDAQAKLEEGGDHE